MDNSQQGEKTAPGTDRREKGGVRYIHALLGAQQAAGSESARGCSAEWQRRGVEREAKGAIFRPQNKSCDDD